MTSFRFFKNFQRGKNKKKENSDNHGQHICSLFQVLTKFLFTTSKSEPDYYRQKLNAPVSSQVIKGLKEALRKLGSFKKITEKFGINEKFHVCHPKA